MHAHDATTFDYIAGMPLPLVFAMVAGVLASLGIGLTLWLGARAERLTWIAELVSAGFLSIVLVMHLGPDVAAGGANALVLALAGAGAAWALSRVGRTTTSQDAGKWALLAPVAAIAVHSFLDGWVHLFTNAHDAAEGATVSTGLIAHEFSEGVVVCLFCLRAFKSSWVAAFVAFVAASASTPIGAGLGLALGAANSQSVLELFLPVMTGFIGFVALSLLFGLVSRFRSWRASQPASQR